MTLIVAYCDGKNISSISDTALTIHEESFRSEPWQGTLKSIVIDKNRFVSFAGAADPALNIIKAIRQNNASVSGGIPTQDILQILLEFTKSLSKETKPDFIIGEITEDNANLYKVARDTIEKDLQSAWIGSKESFGYYQQLFYKEKQTQQEKFPTSEQDFIVRGAMLSALNQVIDDDKDHSVGGFTIPLHSNSKREFEYRRYTNIYKFILPENAKPNEWNPLRFANRAEGGYEYRLLSPSQTGIAAVAIFILQAQLTIVFCRPMREKDELLRRGSQRDAIRWIKENLGFEVVGTMVG
jgi:hypothetical protein